MNATTVQRIRTVRLYGRLGALFGRVHRLAVDSPAEAVRALSLQLHGFQAYLMNAKDHGMGFTVFVGKRNIGREELTYPPGDDDIRIAPVILGSKQGGLLQVVLGIVLIVVGAFTYNPYLVGMGIMMVVGGAVQMLSPQPKDQKAKDGPANEPNYAFNGPVNTQAQGNPVPLLYGRMTVGSAVISAGIQSSDSVYIPIGGGVYTGPGNGGGGGGGCVSVDALLSDGRRAGDVGVGDMIETLDPVTLRKTLSRVTHSQAREAEILRLRTENDTVLTCSTDAPIPTLGGELVRADAMHLLETLTSVNGELHWSKVVDIMPSARGLVQHITCENACFLVGDGLGRYMLHHNLKPVFDFDEP